VLSKDEKRIALGVPVSLIRLPEVELVKVLTCDYADRHAHMHPYSGALRHGTTCVLGAINP
jgi:hypothetical protein